MMMIVTFSLVGKTKRRRRRRQTEGSSHPPALRHNPGRVRSFHPRHKPHCQVWRKKKGRHAVRIQNESNRAKFKLRGMCYKLN